MNPISLKDTVERPQLAWHVHHDVLVELLTEDAETRRQYIRDYKPIEEQPLRLRLFKIVVGHLPREVVQTRQAYDQAWQAHVQALQAYDQALQACNEAWQAYDQAFTDHKEEVEALHRIECPDCPWNGRSIFEEMPE